MPGDAAILRLAEVDSTNLRLADLVRVRGDAVEGTVVVADHQTAGRGRRGRTWEAPPGSSLLVSVAVRSPAGEPQLATVCAALAALGACEEASGFRPRLKWPNDVVAGDLKLAGVLAQRLPSGVVVVGLGLNVDWASAPMPAGATSLRAVTGESTDRDELLDAYLRHLGPLVASLRVPVALANTLDRYRAACSTLGRDVRVDLGDDHFEGRAVAITDAGSLVVETDGGRREVTAGDVVHATDR